VLLASPRLLHDCPSSGQHVPQRHQGALLTVSSLTCIDSLTRLSLIYDVWRNCTVRCFPVLGSSYYSAAAACLHGTVVFKPLCIDRFPLASWQERCSNLHSVESHSTEWRFERLILPHNMWVDLSWLERWDWVCVLALIFILTLLKLGGLNRWLPLVLSSVSLF